MPWVEVAEPYAKPPRPKRPGSTSPWSAPLTVDRGWGELADAMVDADSGLDVAGCHQLTITDSSITDVSLAADDPELEVEIVRSELHNCDLSGVKVRSLRAGRVVGSKLTGTDFSGGTVADTVFEGCLLRYSNLRMAKLNRVSFIDCTLDEVDCYGLEAEHVSFPGSGLTDVNLDGLSATAVDFREVANVSFSAVSQLTGCLVSEEQLAGLAHALAMVVGIDVERPIPT